MEIFNKKIKENFDYEFEIEEDGLYVIEIIASCKSWRQNLIKFISFFKDDDLAVKIDNIEFPKLNSKKGLFDGEAAWNGNNLKGLKKTDIFLIKLEKGNHAIHFLIDQEPYLESVNIFKLQDPKNISYVLESNNPPDDGNRRQWLNIVFVNLSLKNLSITASAEKRGSDDDDLKLIIDGEIQKNIEPKSHKYWYWCGRTLEGKQKEFQKEINLPRGLHYIELWADRMPRLDKIQMSGLERKIFGKIALYQDIEKNDFVNLRSNPDNKDDSNIIAKLKDGESVEILDERVFGSWVLFKSYIWHKVKYQGREGYILSSFMEIEGQERGKIINKIKQKAKNLGIDENLILALAGCESRYKPYAASSADLGKSAKGIFQLTKPAIDQLSQNSGEYYCNITDPFDIEANIDGGTRYVKWLYDTYYKGASQEIEKLIAAYNQGQGYFSPNEPLDYSRLPTKEKQEEAERTVKCVLENKKRKNWRYVLFSLLFVAVSGIGIWQLNKNDFFEPVVSQKEYLLAQVSVAPNVILEKEKNQIVFLNSKKEIVKKILPKKLNLDEIFQTPEEFRKNNLIHFASGVVENPKNVFYFLAASSWSCGVNNCAWVLYRYNADEDFLEIVDKNIIGVTNLYFSPSSENLALVSDVYGGFCNSNSYLKILDLKNFTKEPVDKFKDALYLNTYIDSFVWKNNDEIEIKADYKNCGDFSKNTLERVFIYNIKSKNLELKSERLLAGS